MNSRIKLLLAGGAGFLILGVCFYYLLPVWAGSFSPLSVRLFDLATSAPTNQVITMFTESGVDAGETITLDFADGWSNLGVIDHTDIDLIDDGVDLELAAVASGNTWSAVFSGSVLTITSDTGTIAPGSQVVVRIGTNAVHQFSGNEQIINPATEGAASVLFGGTLGDSGQAFAAITDDNILEITADVGGGGGPSCDTDAPIISNIQVVNITDTQATVTWSTSEGANSLVRYGLTSAYEVGADSNVALELSHTITLNSLVAFTTYHYKVFSTDNCSNTSSSGDLTFTTNGPAGLSVRVLPEKRWPSTGNFRTHLNIKIYQHGTANLLLEKQMDTDNLGYANGLDVSSLPLPAAYDFLIKGYSHLRYRKDNVVLTGENNQLVDFSNGGTIFEKAGDTNGASGDNYVNGMDLSTIAREIYKATEREDLNLDGIVNGIEFAIAVTNLYVWGHD